MVPKDANAPTPCRRRRVTIRCIVLKCLYFLADRRKQKFDFVSAFNTVAGANQENLAGRIKIWGFVTMFGRASRARGGPAHYSGENHLPHHTREREHAAS